MARSSVVEYFAEHEGYSCGYCKCEDTNFSHGMWGHHLTVEDYQDLINRGWRRSGEYCYKPIMQSTCCPQYAISCKALKFKLTKSQKKLLKRINHFLVHGHGASSYKASPHKLNCSDENQEESMVQPHRTPSIVMDETLLHLDDDEPGQNETCDSVSNLCDTSSLLQSSVNQSCGSSSLPFSSGAPPLVQSSTVKGIDPSRPPCRKAKEFRRQRFFEKLQKNGIDPDTYKKSTKKMKCDEKSIEDFLQLSENPLHKLDVCMVPCNIKHPVFSTTLDESYSVYCKYQINIHGDSPNKCTKKQFVRFLVDNPFPNPEDEETGNLSGSYHQQYRLDGKLIAVGVIDILPHCVSSVYLYYDPEYRFMSLGTYATLREIAFTRHIHKTYSMIKYYYMGFYIHSCQKMRYKGNYSPSYLLCPEVYTFHPIEECLPKLDASKYSRLENSDAGDNDGIVHLEEVMILHKYKAMKYPRYRALHETDDEAVVKQYANLVGRKCYRRILLYRS